MKNLTQLIFSLLLLLVSSNIQAQTTDSSIKLLAQPNTSADSMLFRWVVSNPLTWKDGVDKGYTLTRFTTHKDGVALSGAAIRDPLAQQLN